MWFEHFLKDKRRNLEVPSVPRLSHRLVRSQSPMACNSRVCTCLLFCFDYTRWSVLANFYVRITRSVIPDDTGGLDMCFVRGLPEVEGDQMRTGLKWQVRRGSAKSKTLYP